MSNGFDFKKISLENRELLNSALAREAALREELARSNDLLSQARGMVNGATDEWHDEAQKLTGEK